MPEEPLHSGTNMKVLILGHGEHGKTAVARLFQGFTGLTFIDSSLFAAEKAVWPKMPQYDSAQACHADRRNNRMAWERHIGDYNSPRRDRLTVELLKEADTYVGMRRWTEFEASEHHFDLILFVDALKRKPRDPSMSIPYLSDRMVKIDNNGTLDETAENLVAICREQGLCD